MNEEHKAFLSEKTEGQVEHIAGCEACFNYFLFGEKYRCREYPAKHRIKDSDFKELIKKTTGPSVCDDMKQVTQMLRERFNDDALTEDTLHEVTIVPDHEWNEKGEGQ